MIRRPFVIWASWSLHLLPHDRTMMGRFVGQGCCSGSVRIGEYRVVSTAITCARFLV